MHFSAVDGGKHTVKTANARQPNRKVSIILNSIVNI
jgi:hypothetical protein